MMSALACLVCVDDVEQVAKARLPRPTVDYYWSGADEQRTLRRNVEAFKELIIRPRMLRDVSNVNTSIVILGNQMVSMPIGIAPTALHRLAHPDGELATARAATKADTVMICSTIASTSIEDIAAASNGGLLWFQLYVYKDRDATLQLIRRAEKCGCKALVITIDTPMLGKRRADTRNGFTLPPPIKFANFTDEAKAIVPVTATGTSGFALYASEKFDRSLSWMDMKWLTTVTRLPIILKGILTAEDAILAADSGASAVIVSNHGGRQLDGVPATIEALPEVIRAVGDRVEVYLDGGIRTGTDVLKALGLGARMVFLGRPIIWGLAVDGQTGVEHILNGIFRTELINAMTLAGWSRPNEDMKNSVVHSRFFAPSHI